MEYSLRRVVAANIISSIIGYVVLMVLTSAIISFMPEFRISVPYMVAAITIYLVYTAQREIRGAIIKKEI